MEDDIVKKVKFTGGCNSNLRGINRLFIGMKVFGNNQSARRCTMR